MQLRSKSVMSLKERGELGRGVGGGKRVEVLIKSQKNQEIHCFLLVLHSVNLT